MRVAITGAGGQLGKSLLEIFRNEEVIPLVKSDFDVRDEGITERLASLRPDLVIHAAAMTDVDGCELDPKAAFEINGEGTRRVALSCQKAGAPMVYISTDYVFDGKREEPYGEEDVPNPTNVYGQSKLTGEKHVQSILSQYWIVRTAWLYGRSMNNFVEKVLRMAEERPQLSMVTTEVGSPTYTRDLAEGIFRLVRHPPYGIFHLTNSGSCSRHEFAKKTLELAGKPDYPLFSAREYERPAKPPPHAILANTKAAALGILLRPWEEALAAYFQDRKRMDDES